MTIGCIRITLSLEPLRAILQQGAAKLAEMIEIPS
jgi:hypothetical protein